MKILNNILNSQWIPILFFINILYCFGASILDSFVIYPAWKYLLPDKFTVVHQKQSVWIIKAFVIPLITATILNILLFWINPSAIPDKLIGFSLLCMLFNWLFSLTVQIPIHRKLNIAYNQKLYYKLIKTNYIRVGIQFAQLIVVAIMMLLSFKNAF